jgi:hypothetical protein
VNRTSIVSSEAGGASYDPDDAEKASSRQDGLWSGVQVRGGPVRVPDPIGVQQRESGVLIEMTKHPLESGPMRQAGFDASRSTLSCGGERSRE